MRYLEPRSGRQIRELVVETWEEAMHEPVIERLEELLGGDGPFAEVEDHLKGCPGCRKELEAIQGHSALFRSLRAPRELDPPAGFYARVMNRVESQARPSVWSLFGESEFAKRLAYASATFLLLLGSVLVTSSETEEPLASTAPERILAGEAHPVPVTMENPQEDRDVVLVNLATYQQDYQ
jgi:anti-sigma factor RsiW